MEINEKSKGAKLKKLTTFQHILHNILLKNIQNYFSRGGKTFHILSLGGAMPPHCPPMATPLWGVKSLGIWTD